MTAEEYSPRISSWQLPAERSSLPEVFRTIHVPHDAGFLRRLLAFVGAGYLAEAGCSDPGNWSAEIGGGSAYAYRLLTLILISNFIAIFLPALSARSGIPSGRDMAQACRDTHRRLFPIPLSIGVILTRRDAPLALALQHKGFRWIESLALSIFSAIVIPHNLYLHSALVQTRKAAHNYDAYKDAARLVGADNLFTLMIARFVNPAVLALGAATFYSSCKNVGDIQLGEKMIQS